MAAITLTVNGARRDIEVAGDVPLLYVLRNDLELRGPQFGCGMSQCGSCRPRQSAGRRLRRRIRSG